MTRGGKREGAGRPIASEEERRVPVTVRLPRWLVRFLRAQGKSQGWIIEDALIQRYKLIPPGGPIEPAKESDELTFEDV